MLKKQMNVALAVLAVTNIAFGAGNNEERAEYALRLAQMEAVKLLVFTSNLKSQIPDIAQVNGNVEARYNKIRLAYFGSVPASSVGAGALYLGGETSKQLESLFKPFEVALRASNRVLKATWTGIERVSVALGIDKALDFVFTKSSESVNASVTMMKSLVFQGSKESLGFSSMAGLLTSSIYLGTHSADEVVSTSVGRNLLGYDRAVLQALNANMVTLAEAFGLNQSQMEKFKVALVNQIANAAIDNGFSNDSSNYNIDVLDLLVGHNLASQYAAELVRTMSEAYKVASTSGALNNTSDQEKLVANIEFLAMMTAYLQEISASGVIKDQRVNNEIDRVIGSVSAKIKLIGGQVGTY